jgi:hypothetical protein
MNDRIYEKRRLRKIEAYHNGFIDALLLIEQQYGSDDFIEDKIDEHKDKIQNIQKRYKTLPEDPDETNESKSSK